jgi:threonine/homoserine/homoserine lactone efflux protein
MYFYLQAIGVGFLLSIMVGPIFFVLLETSITRGVRAALALDLGVITSDILYIIFALSFVDQITLFQTNENKLIFGFVGGSIFIIYGIYYLFKKSKVPDLTLEAKNSRNDNKPVSKGYFLLGVKGFILNIANPAVIFYWLIILNNSQSIPNIYGIYNIWVFIGILLLTYFICDLFKILAAKKLRPLVNQNLLNALNKLIGLIFMLTGMFQIVKNMVQL